MQQLSQVTTTVTPGPISVIEVIKYNLYSCHPPPGMVPSHVIMFHAEFL